MLVALLFGGFLINMVGQVTGSYDYNLPPEIVEIIKSAIGAALTVLSLGVVAEYRRREECHHEEELPRIEAKPNDVIDIEPVSTPSDRPRIGKSNEANPTEDSQGAAPGDSD